MGNGKYKAVLFSPDGEFVTDHRGRETVGDVWEAINDQGSKWFFYPVCFVATEKTIKAAPEGFERLQGKRIKTVRKLFAAEYEADPNWLAPLLGW